MDPRSKRRRPHNGARSLFVVEMHPLKRVDVICVLIIGMVCYHPILFSATEKLQRFDEQILTEAKKAADAAEFAYNHGATGITDLLDSRRVLRALQLDAATVRADFAKSLAAWKAAMTAEETSAQ